MTRSVSLQSSGDRWQAYYVDENGRPRRVRIGRRDEVTKRDALKRCAEIATDLAERTKPMTLGDFLDRYIDLRTDISEITLARHKLAAARLREHFDEKGLIGLITPAGANDFVAWLRQRKTPKGTLPSDFTVWSMAGLARDILEFASKEGRIHRNPFAGVKITQPKIQKQPHYVPVADVEKVMESCPHAGWRAFFALARFAGLRAKECMFLEQAHVDRKAGVLTVWPREDRKTTKQALRSVPISPRLETALGEAFDSAPEGQPLVCWGVDRENYLKHAGAIMEKAGKSWPKPFQSLRASLETDWQAEHPALAVAAWLGHDLAVSAKHYYTVTPDLLARVTSQQNARDHAREDSQLAKPA